ncbi:hypothetical protein MIR68_009801 [Amoeboaphelidium protococcarum]|nr:hypothetical protein MIR68_009801 [Amoeboaphelidium protococcarum]
MGKGQWKSIPIPLDCSLTEGGQGFCLIEFEEFEDVSMLEECTITTNTTTTDVLPNDQPADQRVAPNKASLSAHNPKQKKIKRSSEQSIAFGQDQIDMGLIYADMKDWQVLYGDDDGHSQRVLCDELLRGLHKLGFLKPTPIQRDTLKVALPPLSKDVLGAAITGSGKSLAFGLPILNYLYQQRHQNAVAQGETDGNSNSDGLVALILTPTRELAMQIRDHLRAVSNNEIDVLALVGGMSTQKQERLLLGRPPIVVATPGRLNEWLQCNPSASLYQTERGDLRSLDIQQYFERAKSTMQFLVIDEADRMVERGKYEDLDDVLKYFQPIDSRSNSLQDWEQLPDGELVVKQSENDKANESTTASSTQKQSNAIAVVIKRQTFVFSATLTTQDQVMLMKKSSGGKRKVKDSPLQIIYKRVHFADKQPAIINLTAEGGNMSRKLKECVIKCPSLFDKDCYLYYFLLQYAMFPKVKTIIFVNSIDGIRRLNPILTLLQIKCNVIHSGMDQRRRLISIDKFKRTCGVLLASDVAARGLDIPNVDHVIHYQVPQTTDLYVHRSGRTARAANDGLSLLLCGPEETPQLKMINCFVNEQQRSIEDFSIDLSTVAKLKQRVKLAVDIDKASHQITKQKHDDDWIRKAAVDLDVELDEDYHGDLFKGGLDSNGSQISIKQQVRKEREIAAKRAELKQLLSQNILGGGLQKKFIASGGKVDQQLILENLSSNNRLLSKKRVRALDNLDS